jgi:chromosome segregation ATPase
VRGLREQVAELQSALAAAQAESAKLQNQTVVDREEYASARESWAQEETELRESIRELSAKNAEMDRQLRTAAIAHQQQESNLAELLEQLRAARSVDVHQIQARNHVLESDLAALQEKLVAAQGHAAQEDRLSKELSAAKTALAASEGHAQKLAHENKELHERVTQQNQELERLATERANAVSSGSHAVEEVARTRDHVRTLAERVAERDEVVRVAREREHAATAAKHAAEEEANRARVALQAARELAESTKTSLETERATVRELQSRLTTLEEERQEHQRERERHQQTRVASVNVLGRLMQTIGCRTPELSAHSDHAVDSGRWDAIFASEHVQSLVRALQNQMEGKRELESRVGIAESHAAQGHSRHAAAVQALHDELEALRRAQATKECIVIELQREIVDLNGKCKEANALRGRLATTEGELLQAHTRSKKLEDELSALRSQSQARTAQYEDMVSMLRDELVRSQHRGDSLSATETALVAAVNKVCVTSRACMYGCVCCSRWTMCAAVGCRIECFVRRRKCFRWTWRSSDSSISSYLSCGAC